MSGHLRNPATREHYERVRSSVLDAFTLERIPDWIQTRTFLENAPFSFEGHEYQRVIAEDGSIEKNIKKCSQMGLSEFGVRFTLGVMDILPDIHVIYTLPTAGFAKTFAKTRIDPVIAGSRYLRSRLNKQIDSFEMKQIGSSYLYLKGTIGQAAAISVPASLLVHDEVDFSDPTVLASYTSRLTHSRYKLKFNLSTPTVAGFGIDEKFQNSRRFFNFVKCHKCTHSYLPDYFTHVKIPGWDKDLREINQDNLHNVRHEEAAVICPRCGVVADLSPANRRWVLENPNEAKAAAGYQVSPFDGPSFITPSNLIVASTQYKRYVDFINFNLGQCAQDKDNALTREELEDLWYPGETPTFSSYVFGIDAGLTMHVVVAGVTAQGDMIPVLLRRVPLSGWWDEWASLCRKYRFSNGIIDSQPYTDLVLQIQATHQKAYGAVYDRRKSPEIFTVADREEDAQRLKTQLRVVSINRNKAFDALMGDLRRQKIKFIGTGCEPEKEYWLSHMVDMKRLQKFDNEDELFFNWEKSGKGVDHYHHATLYCYVASLMRGFGAYSTPYGQIISSFKTKKL